jgi:hypothetical protein
MSESLEDTLLSMLQALKPGESLNPNDVAKTSQLDKDRPDAWRRNLHRVKAISVGLARQGRVEILRKGKPVPADNLKGIYRLRLPVQD